MGFEISVNPGCSPPMPSPSLSSALRSSRASETALETVRRLCTDRGVHHRVAMATTSVHHPKYSEWAIQTTTAGANTFWAFVGPPRTGPEVTGLVSSVSGTDRKTP
jgi:hypothetical protein